MMMSNKQRIDWIDLAKGICIALVVYNHTPKPMGFDYTADVIAGSFRMPLYFVLSGLFFKQYEGMMGFVKRKLNKLLIPFVFFMLFTSLVPSLVRGTSLSNYFHDFYYYRDIALNEPIWFLLCLFEVNVMFYAIQWCARAVSRRYSTALVIAASAVLGLLGLVLGVNRIELPLYLDTGLSSLPFFAFGWWLFRHSRFISSPSNLVKDLAIAAGCALLVYLLARPVAWVSNDFTRANLWTTHLCGCAGTIMILSIAKALKHLPLVSYWGRYSIIILCTHCSIILLLNALTRNHLTGSASVFITFAVAMIISIPLIMFMKKFMPHVCAQKDVLKI